MSNKYVWRALMIGSISLTLDLRAQSQFPSHLGFSRYAVPGMCVAAARLRVPDLVHTVAYQHRVMTVGWSASDDSVISRVMQNTAQQCGARFTLANVAADDRSDLLALALLMYNDALAASVQAKLLETAKAAGVSAQEMVLINLIDAYGEATPPRYSQAEALLVPAALSALPKDRQTVVLAHGWSRLLAAASSRLDRPRMRTYAERLSATAWALPKNAVALPFDVAQDFGLFLAGDPSDSLWNNTAAVIGYADRQLSFLQQTDSAMMRRDASSSPSSANATTGETSSLPLTPTTWFPARPSSAAPTLVLSLATPWGTNDPTWDPNCTSIGVNEAPLMHVREAELIGLGERFAKCQGPDAWLALLTRDYIPKGLSVIVAMSARDSVVFNSARFAPLSLSEGGQREAWYFRTHRSYPVTIAMYEDAAPSNSPSSGAPQVRQPFQYDGPAALLRDATGKTLYSGPLNPQLVVILNQLLRSQ